MAIPSVDADRASAPSRPSPLLVAGRLLADAGLGLWLWLGLALNLGFYPTGRSVVLVPLAVGLVLLLAGWLLLAGGLLRPALRSRAGGSGRAALLALLACLPLVPLAALAHGAHDEPSMRLAALALALLALLALLHSARLTAAAAGTHARAGQPAVLAAVAAAAEAGALWLWLFLALRARGEGLAVDPGRRSGWLLGLAMLAVLALWLERRRGGVAAGGEPGRRWQAGFLAGHILPVLLVGIGLCVPATAVPAAVLAVLLAMAGLFILRWLCCGAAPLRQPAVRRGR
ncbi:MAG TPA: hypothetical protein VFG73_03920 [Rhodanobacteraceae bacterium]|nr:hypothetical protein [Rhodanobacteraceae bacterium]